MTFNAEVTSKGFFARLFNLKFRESVESIVEPDTFTIKKTTILDEQGKRVRHTESTFDQGKMTWTLRDPNNPASEPRSATAEFSGDQLQDVLSAIYFIRTQPLEVGKGFDVFIGDGGRVYTTPVKVIEKKRMKTVLGRVDAFRVNAELFGPERLIDREKGEFSIWITDDAPTNSGSRPSQNRLRHFRDQTKACHHGPSCRKVAFRWTIESCVSH